jgi:hypothetical protein
VYGCGDAAVSGRGESAAAVRRGGRSAPVFPTTDTPFPFYREKYAHRLNKAFTVPLQVVD